MGALRRLTALQHLDLAGAVHADARLLAAAGQLTALQSLHLSRCPRVDDVAVKQLAGLPNLHALNLSHCFLVGAAPPPQPLLPGGCYPPPGGRGASPRPYQ